MVFAVYVAADTYGRKVNFELQFSCRPDLEQLIAKTKSVFDNELIRSKPASAVTKIFKPQKWQLYDDVNEEWIALSRNDQLQHGCQVYAFQPEWQYEIQEEIPDPIQPPSLLSSPSIGNSIVGIERLLPEVVSPQSYTDSPSHGEKVEFVFRSLDSLGTGMIDFQHFYSNFSALGLPFSATITSELFKRVDTNKDGYITETEWQRFGELYPTLLDSLVFRIREHSIEQSRIEKIQQHNEQLLSHKRTAAATEAALEETKRAVKVLEGNYLRSKSSVETSTQLYESLTKSLEAENRSLQQSKEEVTVRLSEVDLSKERAVVAQAEHQSQIIACSSGEDQLKLLTAKTLEAVSAMNDSTSKQDKLISDLHSCSETFLKATNELNQQRDCLQESLNFVREASNGILIHQGILEAGDSVINELSNAVASQEAACEAAAITLNNARREVSEEEINLQFVRSAETDGARQAHECRVAASEADLALREEEIFAKEFNEQRLRAVSNESAILSQEIRLREQRLALEQKETRLRAEHRAFHATSPPLAVG